MPPATESKPTEAPQQVMDVKPPEPAQAAVSSTDSPKPQSSPDGLATPPPETDSPHPPEDKKEPAKPASKPKTDRGRTSAAAITITLVVVIILAVLAVFAYTKSTY